MGSSYSNLVLAGTEPAAVRAALAGTTAFMTEVVDGAIVVFPQIEEATGSVGHRLSERLGCACLVMHVFDSDILEYHLFRNGEVRDSYVSMSLSDYTGETPEGDPTLRLTGLPDELVAAFSGDLEGVSRILDRSNDDFVFAEDRQYALLSELGLPTVAVNRAYCDLQDDGARPTGLTHLS